jgi:AraC-like DNA-binding protein
VANSLISGLHRDGVRSRRSRSGPSAVVNRSVIGRHSGLTRQDVLLVSRLLVLALWHDARMSATTAATQHLRDLARMRGVRDRIDREYAQPLDVEALARGAHMSSGHLSREFRLAFGESPYAYLMTRRIERAMALLRRGDLSVTEVCFAVGCSSLGTFSTRFSELVGVPPSTYRDEMTRATVAMPPCVAKQVTRPVRNREARVTKRQLA